MKGSSILVKKGTAAAGTALAGGRTTSLTLNSETVDVTSADNVNRWRELLPAAGIKTMSVSFSGVLDNGATKDQMIDDLIAQTVDAYGIILDDLGYFEGNFQLAQFEASGEYNGEATFNITLESGGDITYTAGVPS